MIRKSIKDTNKSFTATLAFYVSVAVILLSFTACGGNDNKKITLNSVEDSLAYSSGSLQKIQYMYYIESNCNVDSMYRTVCFEGIEKGYKDSEHDIAYFDGISIGIQLMKFFVQKDKQYADKLFVDGIIYGALNEDHKNSEENKISSDVYNKGLENSKMLRDYISGLKYTGTILTQFIDGFKEGANSVGKPDKYALACGKIFGGARLKISLRSLNKQIYGADTTKSISSDLFYAGFIECNDPNALIPHAKANEVAVIADLKIKESLYSDNRIKGEEFLKDNAKKPGIVTLPSGIQYKEIKKGKGNIPSNDAQVDVHYIGKTIEGEVFINSHDNKNPERMDINTATQCYSEVLQLMPEGSVWEIYVPYKLAYGSTQTKYFKPFSTVIYEIELVKIIK